MKQSCLCLRLPVFGGLQLCQLQVGGHAQSHPSAGLAGSEARATQALRSGCCGPETQHGQLTEGLGELGKGQGAFWWPC